jgi:hypothetical protein
MTGQDVIRVYPRAEYVDPLYAVENRLWHREIFVILDAQLSGAGVAQHAQWFEQARSHIVWVASSGYVSFLLAMFTKFGHVFCHKQCQQKKQHQFAT